MPQSCLEARHRHVCWDLSHTGLAPVVLPRVKTHAALSDAFWPVCLVSLATLNALRMRCITDKLEGLSQKHRCFVVRPATLFGCGCTDCSQLLEGRPVEAASSFSPAHLQPGSHGQD